MKIMLYDHPQKVTEKEFFDDLEKLPSWRQKKSLQYRFLLDRVLSSKAYLLLLQGLQEEYNTSISNISFSYAEHGKPSLIKYPEIYFNLSHCPTGILCVIDSSPVGCDIEAIPEELDLDLCHVCFNEKEVQEVISSNNPCIAFTKLWTMKEAILKLTGEGLTDELPGLLTLEIMAKVHFTSHIEPSLGYVYTICQYR